MADVVKRIGADEKPINHIAIGQAALDKKAEITEFGRDGLSSVPNPNIGQAPD